MGGRTQVLQDNLFRNLRLLLGVLRCHLRHGGLWRHQPWILRSYPIRNSPIYILIQNYNIATTNYLQKTEIFTTIQPLFRTLRCDKTIIELLKTNKYLEKESKKKQFPHILHALAFKNSRFIVLIPLKDQDRIVTVQKCSTINPLLFFRLSLSTQLLRKYKNQVRSSQSVLLG